jgi:hypothetical protein
MKGFFVSALIAASALGQQDISTTEGEVENTIFAEPVVFEVLEEPEEERAAEVEEYFDEADLAEMYGEEAQEEGDGLRVAEEPKEEWLEEGVWEDGLLEDQGDLYGEEAVSWFYGEETEGQWYGEEAESGFYGEEAESGWYGEEEFDEMYGEEDDGIRVADETEMPEDPEWWDEEKPSEEEWWAEEKPSEDEWWA